MKIAVVGTVIFYGLRNRPDGGEQVLFCAKMEGAPATVAPLELPIPDLPQASWEMALAAPGLVVGNAEGSVTRHDGQGFLMTRSA